MMLGKDFFFIEIPNTPGLGAVNQWGVVWIKFPRCIVQGGINHVIFKGFVFSDCAQNTSFGKNALANEIGISMYLFNFIFVRLRFFNFGAASIVGSANSGFPIGSFPWQWRQERQMVSMLPLVTSTFLCPFASIYLLSNTHVVWRGYSWFSNIHWWLIQSQLRPLWGLCIICYPILGKKNIKQDAWSTTESTPRMYCTNLNLFGSVLGRWKHSKAAVVLPHFATGIPAPWLVTVLWDAKIYKNGRLKSCFTWHIYIYIYYIYIY